MSDHLSLLFDDVARLVLHWLPLDARANVACTRKVWHAAAADPAMWAELDFEDCAVRVTDAVLAALCARSGLGLRSLRLSLPARAHVTGDGVVAALIDGGCAGVRSIFTKAGPLCNAGPLSAKPELLLQLAAVCRQLEHTEFAVSGVSRPEAAQVAAALPGPLALSVSGYRGSAEPPGVFSGLLVRSVNSLTMSGLCWLVPSEENALREGLRDNSTLTALEINNVSAAVLGEALYTNRTLKSLKLRCHNMGAADVAVLTKMLRENNTLTSLNLNGSEMGDEFVGALALALHGQRTLMSLSLEHNRIGDDGAVALAVMLRENNTLTSLDLTMNRFLGAAGLAALREALRANRSITRWCYR